MIDYFEKAYEREKEKNENLKSALEKIVIKCHHCGAVAKYFYTDNHGIEYVCEEHKEIHFYEYGPISYEGYSIFNKAIED